jgi:hypothetical protein
MRQRILAPAGLPSSFANHSYPMIRRPSAISISCSVLLGLTGNSLHAGWKDEIGFTRLQALTGGSLPTSTANGLTQVEAYLTNTTNYSPNTSNSLFSNQIINLRSGASGISGHATHVATNFYGSASLLPGSTTVDVYYVSDWAQSGFLNFGTNSTPRTETRAVQNHSWAGSFGSAAIDTEINMRLDYAIDRDGFVCVVGEDNLPNPTPNLLAQSYHTISVGRDDGQHTAGFTTLDGSGRIKPDIVAPSAYPEYATSWTTPMVSGAAGLLHAKLSSAPISLPIKDRPRVIKALLLASATKDTVPNWDNTSSRPLDERYGAGELNIHHAWLALSAGRKTSGNTTHGIRGWAAETVGRNSTKNYFFTIPPGTPPTPFCTALTWHRSVSSGSWTSSLVNLKLELYHASGTTIGSLITTSDSTVDNVELIYDSSLASGDYAIVVTKGAVNDSTPFALAWHSLPAVSVATTQPVAREIDGQQGSVTITRTGDTTLAMQVPLVIGGTAVSGTHYHALPATVTIPAGQSSLTLQITPVSDSLAQGNRSVTVAIAADFALVRDAAQQAVVTIQDKPFDAWRFANFTSPELENPAISGETADPEGDQLANLVEYALGLPPKSPNASPVTLVKPADHLTLSAPKNPSATDITWNAEVSQNLTSWDAAVIITNNSTNFTARDNVLITDAKKRFIRLKITRP